MRKFLLLSLVLFTGFTAFAQDFSNKGKDFWVGYGYHQQMTNGGGGGTQNMLLYFSTDQVTNVTVEIPGLGYSITYPNIAAGTTFSIPTPMPKSGPFDSRLQFESVTPENKGIHIIADKPIIAYAHVYNGSVSGATILYPTNTLGKEYYSVNYENFSNSPDANCWMYVIASDTGTTVVEITPTVATINHPANVPFTVNLTQGQVYNLLATYDNSTLHGGDLTGSKIKSLASANGSCKRIAVFSGSGRIGISCPGGSSASSDNYMVQSLPKTAWGKNYLTLPTAGYNNISVGLPYAFNTYRICVTDPKTNVKVDGVLLSPATLVNNFYYNVTSTNIPHYIEADLPIMVAQYLPSRAECGNPGPAGDGDPEVIYLSPIEQSIKTVRWLACRNSAINPLKHYINVVMPNTGTAISSLRLDGNIVSPFNFTVHPQLPGYSYAVLNVSGSNVAPGISHYLQSDSGFNAIAYGYGTAESYGYNAGTNIQDLSYRLELETAYGNETSPAVCIGATFKFKVYFPDSTIGPTPVPIRFDSLKWRISDPSIIMPNNFPIVDLHPVIDSTNMRNGRQVNWYSLPATYSFNAAGADTIILTTFTSTNEGCGNSEDYVFAIEISDPPVPGFTWTAGGCVAEPYQFMETTPQTPKSTYSWWWDFDDPGSGAANISLLRNPTHIFSTAGIHNVRYVGITTPGCVTDTVTQQVNVLALPSATISGATAVCINAPKPNITFTGANGTPEYIFSYNIDDGSGPGPTLTLSSSGGMAQVGVFTNVAGTFRYNLLSVQNQNPAGNSCIQTYNNVFVDVMVLPNHVISYASGPIGQTVCINNQIVPVTYTLSDGATGATITGLPTGVTYSVTGNTLTIAGAPIAPIAGSSFTYNYMIQTTGNNCTFVQVFDSITVNADHTLTYVSGSTNQTVCVNSLIGDITYALGGGATGAMITGLPAGVTYSVTGNIVTITGTPNTTIGSPFTYTINTNGNNCGQAQPLSGIITVSELPTAVITGNIEVCQNGPWPVVTFTGANGTAPYTFTYTVNNGPDQTISTAVGNSVTVQQPTTTANAYIFRLKNVQEGGLAACSQVQSGEVTVKVNPLPTATISGTKMVCINSASPDITFTGANGTAPYTFTYRINGGPVQTVTTTTGNSVTVAVPTTVANTFTYSLESVQEGGLTACSQAQTGDAVIDISDVFPVPDFRFNDPVCLPNAVVQFQNLSSIANGSQLTYSWNFGDNLNTSTARDPAHQYFTVGPYTVTLSAISNAGCKQDRMIMINNIHPQPKTDFSFDSPAGVCIGDDVTMKDLTDGKDGTVNQWYWDLGDGTIRNTNTFTYKYADTLTYNVSLYTVNSIGCNSDTITKQFTVHPFPKVDAGPDRFMLEGGQITLLPVVYGKDLQFLWTPDQYLIDNRIEKVKVNKPLTDITYTLKVTSIGGCSFSDDVSIKLLKFPVIPNTFTPNNDGINDTWRIDYLYTYPENRVQVFTRTGQLVFESRGYVTPWDGTIKGKPLPFDTYYYIIEPGNGHVPITGYVTIIK